MGFPEKPSKKGAGDSVVLDPSLVQMEGQLSFDEVTKKALQRSTIPGVLVALSQEPKRIFRIEIRGAKKTEPDAIILRLVSKLQGRFSPVDIADDINEIMKMGLFSDVAVYKKELPSKAVELIYELTEIPTIFQIKIRGNEAISEDEIKENMAGLEKYHVANLSRLREFAEKIQKFYVSKGYYLAVVNVSTEKTSSDDIAKREVEGDVQQQVVGTVEIDTAKVLAPDFVDVIFDIKENNQVVINRISFMGNNYLDDDVLRARLRSQENHLLSVISEWGTFREDFLDTDVLILEKLLQDNGFLHAKVPNPEVELSPDKSSINILYPMVENDQYSLGRVTISGDLVEKSEMIFHLKREKEPDKALFLEQKLLKNLSQKEGDIFNRSQMGEDVLAIAELYKDAGYAYVNVSPMPIFNDRDDIVDINIEIMSGPEVYIERIDIMGNEKTQDRVIRRELSLFEGDKYSSSLMRLSEQSVQRLGYFERVEFDTKPGSQKGKMVLTIKVKEQGTGNIQAGAGYGTGGEGLVLRGQISNPNLFGRGQTLSASINWSNYRRMFDVAFVEPYMTYLFDNQLSFAFTAYNRDVFLGEFSRKATGGDVTFGYPLGGPFAHLSRKWKRNAKPWLVPYVFDFEALSLLITYTVERVRISDLTTPVRKYDLYQGVPRYTTSIRPALRLDQRDNRIYPSRGLFLELRSEFASGYLGSGGLARLENHLRKDNSSQGLKAGLDHLIPRASANNYIRYEANLRAYHNLDDWFFLKGLVLKTNLEMGILDSLGKPLLFENYALGGSNTVRGYAYRTISPTERASALFPFDRRLDFRVGGNKQFHGSFELEFPIIRMLKISGVMFFDFGNVYSPDENFFYIGGKSKETERVKPHDPLHLYRWLGLYSSAGFGVRWQSPFGYLRFEWGFPLNPRPLDTPGLLDKDSPVIFEFAIGPSF